MYFLMFFYSSGFQTIDFDQLVGLKINGLCPALFLNETENIRVHGSTVRVSKYCFMKLLNYMYTGVYLVSKHKQNTALQALYIR